MARITPWLSWIMLWILMGCLSKRNHELHSFVTNCFVVHSITYSSRTLRRKVVVACKPKESSVMLAFSRKRALYASVCLSEHASQRANKARSLYFSRPHWSSVNFLHSLFMEILFQKVMRFVIMTNIQIPFSDFHSRMTKVLWTQFKAIFQLKDLFMQMTSLVVSSGDGSSHNGLSNNGLVGEACGNCHLGFWILVLHGSLVIVSTAHNSSLTAFVF